MVDNHSYSNMPTVREIQQFREKGKTFSQIALHFGLSKQRIHAIFTGYQRANRMTDSAKKYRLHQTKHTEMTKLKKECTYCARDFGKSMVNTHPLTR